MKAQSIQFTRVKSDVNGNPRYVCHFLNFLKQDEVYAGSDISLDDKYSIALQRAKELGGKKFHNKQYGGGIVFQAYATDMLEESILELVEKAETF